ncbi:hypothetical protein [Aestuariivirga litoralis]|uniref:hypothetical protein n=1 Tax=Aestuariivirga litoralis TaxID=2650924 RepID=UPI0018C82107|nr:hypothetical protein [Aestuariivirga litoralis]MBG1232251.1 hypothetical protein [Aestuariivirga litoralis]
MMGRLFWLITLATTGAAVYLATVLYMPGLLFHRTLTTLTEGMPPNSFFIMKPEDQTALVSTATKNDIVGLCLVDVNKGKVVISASVPAGLWTFSIFDSTGRQVYGINDAEAASGAFTVELSQARSVLQQLTSKNEQEDNAISNVGWHAELSDSKGIVVVWVPVADGLRRAELENVVKATRCEPK